MSRFLPLGHCDNAAAPEVYYSRVLRLLCESDGAGGYIYMKTFLFPLANVRNASLTLQDSPIPN